VPESTLEELLSFGDVVKRVGETKGSALNRIFRVTLYLKGLDGFLELIGGVLLLLVPPNQIGNLLKILTQHELSEDPQDLVADALVNAAHGLTLSASLFGAIYLLLHGFVKVVLVWAVLRDFLWAYPWMMAFLLVFIVYQVYQLVVKFSLGMALLTVFDLLILWLTWYEYRMHKSRKAIRGT
jgi:uncharacterized membrane protein